MKTWYSAWVMSIAVRAEGVAKRYAGLFGRKPSHALRGIDLAVPAGTAFGLIGLNGAGKTTFIKTVLGVVRPDAGAIAVLGGSPDDVKVRARIGYLAERLYLPFALTPRAWLSSVARIKRLPTIGDEVERQLARVGMIAEAGRRMGGFSKGMKQRVGVAAAMLGAPALLVLDEPTDGVDPLGRAEIRRLLEEEKRRGATIFLNSHLLTETERICDRIGVIAGGRLVREGALADLCESRTAWRLEFVGGAPSERLVAAGLVAVDGGGWRCEAEGPDELDAVIGRTREAGARLVGLRPETRDLEDVLAEAVGKGRP